MVWWSSSTFVTTATSGASCEERAVRLVRLGDHPLPAAPAPRSRRARRPRAARRRSGSRARARRPPARGAVIAAVVVLPCVPATAISAAQRADLRRAARRGGGPARRARAPPRARACRRDRGRDDQLDAGRRRARARGRCAARSRPRAALACRADSARSQPDTSAPSRARDEREAAHAGAADADEVQAPPAPTGRSARRRASIACPARRRAAPPRSARRRRGAQARAAAAAMRASRSRSPSSAPTVPREPCRRRARRRRPRPRRPRRAIQRAFAAWCSAVACGYGTSIAGLPAAAISNTEPPARATTRSPAASGVARGSRGTRTGGSALGGRARSSRAAQLGEVAPARRRAATITRLRSPARSASSARRLMERAPRLPPNTSTQRASGVDAEPRARAASRSALEHRARHRPAGDDVALAVAAVDREGEADAPGERRKQPVREPEAAVGLGQHQRRAARAPPRVPPGRRRSRRRRAPRRRRAAEQAARRADRGAARARPRARRAAGCGGRARSPSRNEIS